MGREAPAAAASAGVGLVTGERHRPPVGQNPPPSVVGFVGVTSSAWMFGSQVPPKWTIVAVLDTRESSGVNK
jgi:hypothetical protein